MKQFLIGYAVVVFVMSLITFCTYGFDKYRAKRERRRVPEKTLHLMALLGGWPGAWLGQKAFRHKTQKASFRLVFWLSVIANLAVLAGVVFLASR